MKCVKVTVVPTARPIVGPKGVPGDKGEPVNYRLVFFFAIKISKSGLGLNSHFQSTYSTKINMFKFKLADNLKCVQH